MSQISAGEQRSSRWKISKESKSKSIIKDQSVHLYKLPSKFQPTKTNPLNSSSIHNTSMEKHNNSQILDNNPKSYQSMIMPQGQKSMLSENRLKVKLASRFQSKEKLNSMGRDSPRKTINSDQPSSQLKQHNLVRILKRNPSGITPVDNGETKKALNKIKSQFIIFKQKIMKDLKELSEMIQKLAIENHRKVQKCLKELQITLLNNERANKNKQQPLTNPKSNAYPTSQQVNNASKNTRIKLSSKVFNVNLHCAISSTETFNGSFGCINISQQQQKMPLPLPLQSSIQNYDHPISTPKYHQQVAIESHTFNSEAWLKHMIRQQTNNLQANTKSTLDKCNHMVETIGILNEINSSPVVNRSCSNENLMVEEYKKKLLQISRSNQKLIKEQTRLRYKGEPRMKVNQKLDKFYTAIEKLKEDVNEIRNISDINQIRKKYN